MRTSLVGRRGTQIDFGSCLGRGGEGAVYRVRGRSDIVVKVFHQPLHAERVKKIVAMTGVADRVLRQLGAWPLELVFDVKGSPSGILMPRVRGRALHVLYSPKSRKDVFSSARFDFLVHAAANLARVFAQLHDRGVVIGDVNSAGFLVGQDAKVTAIDCDSFQLRVGQKVYRCDIGTALFTPPELQGRNLSACERTKNHDNFGLAVLIFHLLSLGCHPFAGRHLRSCDLLIETAIRECRYAFGPYARQRAMKPPLHAPKLDHLSPKIMEFFERDFAGRDLLRPTPAEWVEALDELYIKLVQCPLHPGHVFPSFSRACPWCQIEHSTGATPFEVFSSGPYDDASSRISEIVERVRRLSVAPFPKPLARETFPPAEASNEALKANVLVKLLWRVRLIGCILVLVLVLVLVLGAGSLWLGTEFFWILAGLALAGLLLVEKGIDDVLRPFETAYGEALERHRDLAQQYASFLQCGGDVDHRLALNKKKLDALQRSWAALPRKQRARLDKLKADCKRDQLQKFLDQHRIAGSRIAGIGVTRLSVL